MIRLIVKLLALMLVSCSVTPIPQAPSLDPGATLHVYLQPVPAEARGLTLTVASINARNVDGKVVPLLEQALELRPEGRLGRQTKLLAHSLPAGQYLGFELVISRATLQGENGRMDLLVEETARKVPEVFRIGPDRAVCLFLSLSPDRLVTDGFRLTAEFSLWKPQPPLPELKGLASQPQNGTLTLFEKKSPAIYSVLAVGRRPSGLVLDQPGRRAFVALGGENAIASIDLVNERIERKVRLRPADRPRDLALSGDGSTLLVANSGSNSVSLLDAGSLAERERVLFSSSPSFVFTSHGGSRGYVMLPDENAVAAVDLRSRAIVATVALAEAPIRGVAGPNGRKIYLLTRDSSDLLVLDAQTLVLENRVFVGYDGRCLAVNRSANVIYVGLASGEVAVVDPQVDLPIDSFTTRGEVLDIVVDVEQNSLFILSGGDGALEKYDLVSKKRLAVLDLGAASHEVALMGER